jgi:putative phosphoribosyl transferase
MSSGSLTHSSDSTVWFTNRHQAGEQLAQKVLQILADSPPEATVHLVVYALPRGGLAVAAPIAQHLHCPLDVIIAKKITRPENPELAIGAVTSDGHTLWLPRSRSLHEPANLYEAALHEAQKRASLQDQQFASSRPQVNPTQAITLVVDDGVATGMTMAVAIQALRAQNPAQIWICVPVAPPEIMAHLQSWADQVVVLATPSPFQSVSRFYQEFNQVEMNEAIDCLHRANQHLSH